MSVKTSYQFNRPATALMDDAATLAQVLQVKLNSDQIKQIEALHCSYTSQANIGGVAADAQTAIANTFIQGRVIIVGEEIDLSGLTAVQLLDFHPFQNVIFADTIRPSNILFDKCFINELDIDFTLNALEVANGTGCSVLMSSGFSPIDTLGTQVTKLGCLNVNGQYKSEIVYGYYDNPR